MMLFIETAIREEPRIALGVYFQIFGGIRIGGAVCLSHGAIHPIGTFGRDGFILDIFKRDFRLDLKRVESKGQVKKMRHQPVISVGSLGRNLYKAHLQQYGRGESDAVFNNLNKKAMTAKEYSRLFGNIKSKFLEELKNSGDPNLIIYARRLEEYKWSTHICRGIFSNLVAKHAKNIQTVTLMRGDSNYESALTYLADIEDFTKQIENVLCKLYEDTETEDLNV